jgi:hypothetical protein
MTVRTIYCDESGFTGHNFLDKDQPFFAIASTDLDEVAAEAILKTSFPRYRGSEFKFGKLWGTNNKYGIVRFCRELQARKDSVLLWIIDKKFIALTKMVDFLVEPCVTEAGFDFYADGFCWKYANYIHYGITEFGEPELYDTLVQAYQAFSRAPSEQALMRLQHHLAIISRSLSEPIDSLVGQMALGAELFKRYHSIDTFKGSDEIQLTSLLALVSDWRKKHLEDFAIVHDASSNFFRHRTLWEKITNSNVPPQTHPLGDGSVVQYPLRVTSTQSINSRDCYSVQLCDVLAGLATKYFDPRQDERERELLAEALERFPIRLHTLPHERACGIRPG